MIVTVVWSLTEGVIDPPREHEIPEEVLVRELAERKRVEEAREAERMLA